MGAAIDTASVRVSGGVRKGMRVLEGRFSMVSGAGIDGLFIQSIDGCPSVRTHCSFPPFSHLMTSALLRFLPPFLLALLPILMLSSLLVSSD